MLCLGFLLEYAVEVRSHSYMYHCIHDVSVPWGCDNVTQPRGGFVSSGFSGNEDLWSLRSILFCICRPLEPLAPDSRPLDCVTQDQWLQTLCTSVQGETRSQSLPFLFSERVAGTLGRRKEQTYFPWNAFFFSQEGLVTSPG